MTKKYCIFLSALFCAFLGVFLVANAVSPDRTFSQMENRNLEQLPVPSVKTLLNGQFMKDFETYTTDQFVGRDGWIALKSTTERVLGKKENNNVYFAAGDTLISRFDEPDGEKVTNNLNYVNNFVENVDIPVTFSLIPTQACIWADRLPAGEIMPHGADICSLSAKTGEGVDPPTPARPPFWSRPRLPCPVRPGPTSTPPCGSTRARTSSTAPTTTGPAWGLTTAIPDWPPPWATPPYP